MSVEEIHVPDLGGSDEVEVIELSVSPGDQVQQEDPIVVVESDKATVELPSPLAGRIQEIKVSVGDRISEGDLVATVDTADSGGGSAETSEAEDDSQTQNNAAASQPQEAEGGDDDAEEAASPENEETGETREETVRVPDIGDAESVPVVEINVSEGDEVAVDDPLVTVESDKAAVEIPSPHAGKVSRILVKKDAEVSQGDELLVIAVRGASSGGQSADKQSTGKQSTGKQGTDKSGATGTGSKEDKETGGDRGDEKSQEGASGSDQDRGRESRQSPSAGQQQQATATDQEQPTSGKVHAGPAVRKLARELGVDLTQVKGSGPKQRILKDDVQQFVKRTLSSQGSGTGAAGGVPNVKLPDFSKFGKVERKPMNRLQSATAVNMHRSWLNVPHVTQFDEADITEMNAFRKSQKAEAERRGVKLTPVAFLLKACAHALTRMPEFNVSLDMSRKELIQKHYCHLGVAVDTPDGLMVPVIRDVDQKGIWEIAGEAQALAQKARDKKLSPSEMQGACFTVTSLGGIGGTAFTPIVNTPEVAILGVSRASMKPVWNGKDFEPRLMLPLSLSYDHRAVNGADAARFTALLCRLLGDLRELLM